MLKRIAVIPARGSSKRIPRKNIKDFLGQPILSYSILTALQSNLFDQVMVSTEDPEIKELAIKYGASVPFLRSEKNADDYATTAEVLLEVLMEYEKIGQKFDIVCCIYPTAPFITVNKLGESIRLLEENNADSVIPIVKFSYPPQRCFDISDSYLKYQSKEYILTRSQDLKPLYHDCGQFYTISVSRFTQTKEILMDKTLPLYMNQLEVQDIDNENDWKLAELKYRIMKGER